MHIGRFALLGSLLIVAVSTLVAAAVLISVKRHSFNPDRDSLIPDLSIRLDCPGVSKPADDFWEHNFADLGFRPLNPPALAKKNGTYYAIQGQYIWGIDSRNRILHVYGPSTPYGMVDIVLRSPPPTVHDQQLEEEILKVIAQSKCNVQSVHAGANKSESRPNYFNFLDIIKGWYAQAEVLEHR